MAGRDSGGRHDVGTEKKNSLASRSWKTLGVLSVIFGVIAGPKILSDQHELMCGWSSGWKRLAGWFGDCAAYEKKPTQVVISSSPGPREEIRPKAVIYQEQFKQFDIALRSNDLQFLEHLSKQGFRLQEKESCRLLLNIGEQPTETIAVAVEQVSRFSPEAFNCTGAPYVEGAIPPDSHLLESAAFFSLKSPGNANACRLGTGVYSFARHVAAIDAWTARRGRSEDFRKRSQKLLAQARNAAQAKRNDFVAACVLQRHGRLQGSPGKYATETDNLMNFATPCVFKEDYAPPDVPSREMAVSLCSRSVVEDAVIRKTLNFGHMFPPLERWSR